MRFMRVATYIIPAVSCGSWSIKSGSSTTACFDSSWTFTGNISSSSKLKKDCFSTSVPLPGQVGTTNSGTDGDSAIDPPTTFM